MSRSSSTPTPGRSWAGGPPQRCAPPWSSTPWSRPSGPASAAAGPAWPGWCITTTRVAQYTSIAFTERLAAAGAQPSVGSVGDAYDNALAESVIGLYKTELIKPQGPWRTAEQVEIATLHYVDWFNRQRLFEACGDIPPAELEAAYYRQNAALAEAG
jgi:transposase InsO family protein